MPELESRAAVEPSVRQKVRVTGLYATPWHLADGTAGRELPWSLDLGRLEQYDRLSAEQLPRVLYRETLDAGAVTCRRWQPVDAVTAAWAWLFLLPSGQLVAALTVDVRSGVGEVIDLLEDCYYADVLIGRTPVEQKPEQPVDLDDRDLAAAEPHDDEPALGCQRTQAVGDPVPTRPGQSRCRPSLSRERPLEEGERRGKV
jgi:hypothetical protein